MTNTKSAKMSDMKKQELFSAIVLISPALIYLLVWLIGPAIYAFFISFTDYDLLRPKSREFVWFRNYIDLMGDNTFKKALTNTMFYALGVVPLQTAIALFLAVVANRKSRFKTLFRVVYYLPGITSTVAIASIFMFIFSKNGVANQLLTNFGIESINWATSKTHALPLVMLMAIWASTGFYMLIFLAGLQDIPTSVYEAAEVDGANGWQQFINITFPMLKDKTFFVLVIGLIGTFQVFDGAYIVSGGKGGPSNATMTIVLHLYTEAFKNNQMGYASAIAFVLFAIIFTLTIIQKKLFKDED